MDSALAIERIASRGTVDCSIRIADLDPLRPPKWSTFYSLGVCEYFLGRKGIQAAHSFTVFSVPYA